MADLISNEKLPKHIGIILDANGRWAKMRGKERSYGHQVGSDNVERVISYAFERGIKVMSLYAFSCENWARPKPEVDELMRLLDAYMKKFIKKILKNDVKLSVMGDITALSPNLQKSIKKAVEQTADRQKFVLNIGINYGGRQEIVNAVNQLVKDGKEITVDNISKNLYTAPFGEPDIIVRTGGEYRLSNFMLFQGAYSELYFTDVLWPDFDEKELDKVLVEYSKRTRRFGKV